MRKVLIYGYGNPGRQDDGLGVLLAGLVEDWSSDAQMEHVEVDSNYQLNIEDAYNLADYHTVVFVDATINESIKDYQYDQVAPNMKTEFTMHAVSPGFIIGLCKEIYGNAPESYLLQIRGYSWEFMKDPTRKAEMNLQKAFSFLKKELEKMTVQA